MYELYFLFLVSAEFLNADASYTRFQNTSCVAASFAFANLTHASFWRSNLKHASFERADLTMTDFTYSNLYNVTLTGTRVRDIQLEKALSIYDALLPNGTRARNKNLIRTGEPNCNIFQTNGWILRRGNLSIAMSNQFGSYCDLILQPMFTGATIYQRVNLSNAWDATFHSYSQAVLRANLSFGVSMELIGINNNSKMIDKQVLSEFHYCNTVTNSIFHM